MDGEMRSDCMICKVDETTLQNIDLFNLYDFNVKIGANVTKKICVLRGVGE